jgi:trehalose-6-phosphate synthase
LEALIVNPYDARGMAQALRQAASMPEEERRERMTLMRAMVRENNVYRWAGRMLSDAARLRKRQRVADPEGAAS